MVKKNHKGSQPSTAKRKIYRKKRWMLPVTIVALLLLFRLLLPYGLEYYVNGVLRDIPGYYGGVSDVDVHLFRGAYDLEGLYLNKLDGASEVPFLQFEESEVSLEWNALLDGEIVSEITLIRPVLVFVFEDQIEGKGQEPELDDWTRALTDLVPIDINNLRIRDGKAAFVQLTADPSIDLYLNEIYLHATNLQNVVQTHRTLPSTVKATAVSIGGGKMELEGKLNLVKQIPDMDMALSLENASATAINDFTKHYAGIDFAEGTLDLFSEIAIADGFLTGYIKPILRDAKFIGKDDGFLATLWEGFVGFFKFILKNHKENTLATKIPIEGDLNAVKSNVWSTIFNIFKNAWIQGFKGNIDNDVNFEDAEEGADEGKE